MHLVIEISMVELVAKTNQQDSYQLLAYKEMKLTFGFGPKVTVRLVQIR